MAAGLVHIKCVTTDVGPSGKLRETSDNIVISVPLMKILRGRVNCVIGLDRKHATTELMRYAENQNNVRLPADNDYKCMPITLNTVHYAIDMMMSVPSNLNAGPACFY